MTGYASAQSSGAPHESGQADAGAAPRLGVEIRAVNSRFLDLSFRLADDLRQHEPALRELLQSRLKRGKVEVRAGLESATGADLRDPGARLLQRLNTLQDQIRSWLPQAQPLSVAEVLRLAAAGEAPTADSGARLLPLAQETLEALLSARAREGERLVTMLRGHLQQLRALAEQARPLVPQLVEQQRTRFLERWKDAMGLGTQAGATPEAAQDRALSEATAFAIRIDVAEELTRLAAHLDEIERLLARGGEVGKRLDFLIQELHREANTLGAKSAALELTRISVDMKVLIEQMREQVQNIE
jgi:uncharacterized protein (TIGR00255 family)